MKTATGERYMRARQSVKLALRTVNELWANGDINAFAADDIERLITARRELMLLRYPKPLRAGNANRCHGGRDC